PRGGRPPVGGEAATLAGLVEERNDATLAEYADRLAERTGVRRSTPALWQGRAAQPLVPVPGAEGARPGPEEKTLKAAEQDREDVAEARRAWRAELARGAHARRAFTHA